MGGESTLLTSDYRGLSADIKQRVRIGRGDIMNLTSEDKPASILASEGGR